MTWGEPAGGSGEYVDPATGQPAGGRQHSGGYADNEAVGGYGGYQPSGYAGQQNYGAYGGGYQGLGTYGTPPGGGNKRRLVIVALVAVLLAAVGTGVGIVLFRGKGANHDTVAQPGTTTATATTTASPGPATTSAAPGDSAGPAAIPPKVPGWQVVPIRDHSIAYDVPPTWKVNSLGTIIGFEDKNGKPLVTLNTSAEYLPLYCTGHSGATRGSSGLTSVPHTDAATAATDMAKKIATLAWDPTDDYSSPPTVTVGAPKAVKVGKADGFEVVAHATAKSPGDCNAPAGVVDVIAVAGSGDLGVMVAWADTGVPNATSEQDLHSIASSLRGTR